MVSCVPVIVGDDPSIDNGVLLGYKPGRQIELALVRIGDRARLRFGTIIYASVNIGSGFETGHNVVIREQTAIGNECAVWNNSTVDYGCTLGNRVRIHCNVYVCQYTTLEDDVFLAPGVMLANDPHPICTKCMQGPTIRAGVRVGINSVIMPHVTVGKNSLVGAGSVVTRDVPDGSVVIGSPARVICRVDELECPFGIVRPYEDQVDVRRRPDWETLPPLPRPIQRPDSQS